MTGVFQDLTIVDVSGSVATSYAAKLFADYGARVINLEPAMGFMTRGLKPLLPSGESAMHGYLHANKISVIARQELFSEEPLASVADLVIYDPELLPRADYLARLAVSTCSVSWYGESGRYSGMRGSDATIQALTGLMRGIGTEEGPPIIPPGYQAQMIGGISAFNGALGHLLDQRFNPVGATQSAAFVLETSIFEANLCFTDLAAINAFNDNPLPPRMGINRFPPTYPLGIWPCKDGWLGVTTLAPNQWKALCKLLDLEHFADIELFQSSVNRLAASDLLEPEILKALAEHSAEDLFYRGQAMRIPLARVPTMEELFSVDQYQARQAFSTVVQGADTFSVPSTPFRLFRTPPHFGGPVAALGADAQRWQDSVPDLVKDPTQGQPSSSAPPSGSASAKPLQGLRIIDLSMGWAGPLATRNLADMGAQVIKVESCERFDWWRSWEATEEWIADDGAEKSLQYLYVNRNKLDITLDLEHPTGRELLLRLVATADALVENYSGSVLPKLKLSYEHLIEANPELVMVSMPAFGSTGPWAEFRAYGSTVEHSSGLPHLVGDPDQAPTMQHVAFGDAVGGLNGSAAILTALWHKQRTGEGQFVDLSQVECLFPLAAPGILHQSVHGESPTRFGNAHPDHAPHGVYPCLGEDAWVLIQITSEAEWQQLTTLVPALDKSADLAARLRQRAEIDASLAQWTAQQSAEQVMHSLQGLAIIAAKLNDGNALLHEPHLRDRDYLQWLERAYIGRQPHPSAPFRTAKTPIPITSAAPTLGQHNQLVLGEMLQLSQQEIAELEALGIIGDKPRMPSRR